MNNYEKWCEEWRIKFLNMDLAAIKERLPELKDEGAWLIISHFSRKFGISKEDGQIIAWEDAGYEIDAFDCMPIRFLFWEGDEEFPDQANLLLDPACFPLA